jgi:hypothetical protein
MGRNLISSHKSPPANQAAGHFTRENLQATLDLEARLNEVCEKLRKWNGLESRSKA